MISETTEITFATLADMEPALLNLANYAIGVSRMHRKRIKQGDWHYYEATKRQAARYVGWTARLETLRTSEAYEIVMRHLTRILEAK